MHYRLVHISKFILSARRNMVAPDDAARDPACREENAVEESRIRGAFLTRIRIQHPILACEYQCTDQDEK